MTELNQILACSKPLLSTGILANLMFHDNGKCNFKHFEDMHYWVKKGVCLFYNYPIQEGNENSFYIGYAEMRQGEYIAVAFKWISTVEELTNIYEAIQGSKISDVS